MSYRLNIFLFCKFMYRMFRIFLTKYNKLDIVELIPSFSVTSNEIFCIVL